MNESKFRVQIVTILIVSLTRIEAGVLQGSTLPGNIIPTHYKLHLTFSRYIFFDHYGDKYSGKVEINLKATKENVTSIILHTKFQRDMEYQEIALHYPNGTKEDLQIGEFCNKNETQELKSKKPLPLNESLRLSIKFTNTKLSHRAGLFRLYIQDTDRQFKGYFLVTHGQPDHARKMFPCFDEPAYKATFEILVSIPDEIMKQGYHVMSNTDLDRNEKSGDATTFIFKKTPIPMSTYLVAILVAKINNALVDSFNSSYPIIETNEPLKEFKTWGHSNILKRESIQKMHNISRGIIEAFTKKFNVGFAFPKLHQAIIESFPYFGMENFGLIFLQMQKFKYGDVKEVSYIQAHEIAHQWFGNLVTGKDWTNDFWIQEGFAHFFGIMVMDYVKVNGKPPGYYDFANDFVINNVLPALKTDSYNNAPPVIEAIKTLFGADNVKFTYDKAAALIRMLKLSFGEDVFKKAMQYYFRLFKEKNANTTDLLTCFDLGLETARPNPQIKKPSEIKFENWIKYRGYPLVTVDKSLNQPNVYLVSQERFIHRNATQNPVEHHKWHIPITYSTSNSQNFNKTEAAFWLTPQETSAKIELPSEVKWIILNHQIAGYYRVNYDKKNWDGIIKALNKKKQFQKIHELNRAQLLDDSLILISRDRRTDLSFRTVMKLYKYLKREKKYYPWKAAIERVKDVTSKNCKHFLGCTVFKKRFHSTVAKKYKELQRKPSGHLSYQDQMLRELITNYYCKNVVPSCPGKP